MKQFFLSILLALTTAWVVVPARAQDAKPRASRPENGYWSEGSRRRLFLSGRTELGTPYVKPTFSLGYGMPHWIWAGVDANAIVTNEFAQAYTGLRASTPLLDVAFGVRDTLSFDKRLLAPALRFTRDEVLDASGPRARYLAWEAEAVSVVPLPHAALVADVIAVHTLDVPDHRFVYDESYRAVVGDPTFAVLRMAAVARLLNENALSVGALVEHVFEANRTHPVWRVGPVASIQLTDHLDATMVLTLNVYGPDDLGLTLGAYGVAGLRYRWATGERTPAWPWQGPLISGEGAD